MSLWSRSLRCLLGRHDYGWPKRIDGYMRVECLSCGQQSGGFSTPAYESPKPFVRRYPAWRA